MRPRARLFSAPVAFAQTSGLGAGQSWKGFNSTVTTTGNAMVGQIGRRTRTRVALTFANVPETSYPPQARTQDQRRWHCDAAILPAGSGRGLNARQGLTIRERRAAGVARSGPPLRETSTSSPPLGGVTERQLLSQGAALFAAVANRPKGPVVMSTSMKMMAIICVVVCLPSLSAASTRFCEAATMPASGNVMKCPFRIARVCSVGVALIAPTVLRTSNVRLKGPERGRPLAIQPPFGGGKRK